MKCRGDVQNYNKHKFVKEQIKTHLSTFLHDVLIDCGFELKESKELENKFVKIFCRYSTNNMKIKTKEKKVIKIEIVCPECGDTNCHLEGLNLHPSRLVYTCESGHVWDEVFQFHGGWSWIEAQNIKINKAGFAQHAIPVDICLPED